MTRVKQTVETEWTFDTLDLRPVERWLASLPSLLIQGDAEKSLTSLARPPRRIVDSYLDTDDWRMAQGGFVVRIRSHGRQDEITLKERGVAEYDGLREPLEVMEELPEAGIGALGSDGPVGRRIYAMTGRRPLRPVLHVRSRRRPFSVRVGGEDVAEVALDETLIAVGSGQRPMQLRRVEVVVQAEWADALRPIVMQLRIACGLQPATLSKFDAGLLALGVVIPGPPDLGPTEIGSDTTLGDLAYAVLRRQLSVLRAKEPGTRLGEDIEELHDMRVATRRLRAALDLFVELLPVRARHYRDELSWLADVLGTVRDLDVQLEAHAAIADSRQQELWSELTVLLIAERDVARRALLDALNSVRWERLVNGMAAMVRQGSLRRSAGIRLPAQVSVPDLIESCQLAVVKAARRAKRSGEAADFHRLRIRCKRLRYSLEFSAELYGGRTARYTRQLTGLQDKLGLLQDAEVAANRLSELAIGEARLPASTIFAMGGAAEQHRRAIMLLLQRLPQELPRVRGREWQDLMMSMERDRDRQLALVPPIQRTLRALPGPPSPPDMAAPNPGAVTTLVFTDHDPVANPG